MPEDVIFRAEPRLWMAHPFSVTLFGLLSATVAPFVSGGHWSRPDGRQC